MRLQEVSKKYRNVVALDSISLTVSDKEFAVLLGPSGCGKTTTLRCIAGLEDPDHGEIYIGDAVVNNLAPKDRDVAVVFQNYALYPHGCRPVGPHEASYDSILRNPESLGTITKLPSVFHVFMTALYTHVAVGSKPSQFQT